MAVITLNRTAVRNAMNRELSGALMEALQRVREDTDIRVAVITGAGRTFSAGADLKERSQIGRAADASAGSIIETSRAGGFSTLAMHKPLLAAVDGYCLAAGFELALTCDMRICTPEARFGLPEITRGFFPGGGGPQRLMRAIPQAMAMEMILTGDPIDAATALRVGLVSRIVPADELLPTARQIAQRIAGHAPLAVTAAKEGRPLSWTPSAHAVAGGWPRAPWTRRWSKPCVSVARCVGLSARPRMRVKGLVPSPSAGRRATRDVDEAGNAPHAVRQ
jgi:enoyl-CoA hydratase/carnithine racemase